jgi:hypothetical protein
MKRLDTYQPPTKDSKLISIAKKHNLKYVMSTSTISSVLSQMFFLFSNFRNPNFDFLSSEYYRFEPLKYMISQRKPVTAIVRHISDGIYGMDSDKGPLETVEKILMEMGKILENQITLPVDVFEKKFVFGKMEEGFEPQIDHHRYSFVNN